MIEPKSKASRRILKAMCGVIVGAAVTWAIVHRTQDSMVPELNPHNWMGGSYAEFREVFGEPRTDVGFGLPIFEHRIHGATYRVWPEPSVSGDSLSNPIWEIRELEPVSDTVALDDPKLEIDVSGFRDSAGHWRHIRDENRVIQVMPNQGSYRADQVTEICANILLFQRDNGGWPKDYDMQAILTDEQRSRIAETKSCDDTSFDNHNTFPQVEYLARAYVLTKDERLRKACERGLDFMLQAQYADGGVPQWFPRTKGFHGAITFNDGAMIGVLRVLKDAGDAKPHFNWLDDARRKRAADAAKRGIDCILKCQIRVDGKLTGWCQQHDKKTYQAIGARTFELASICPGDTTEIVEYLMSFEKPTPAMIEAVDAAVVWLKQVALPGVKLVRKPAPKVEFERKTSTYDMVVVSEKGARPIWARHYEIGTNRPIFAGRDGVKKYQFADIERERRTGTAWYGYWPERLLGGEYTRWRERVTPAK